jgi:cytochrome b6-f complex iron-sulfur subunit
MAERDDDTTRAERLERYLEALLGGRRPSPDQVADRDEAEMARLAAELSATASPEAAQPDPAFLEQLRLRMRQADQGVEHVQVPPPVRADAGAAAHSPATERGRLRLSRRDLFGAAAGAAVGLAAGAAGLAALRGVLEGDESGWEEIDLVDGPAEWVSVARVADLPEGAVVPFSTAAFNGFVLNDGGEIRALSASCTHLGCQLQYRPSWPDLRCPCHNASFNLRGWLANGPIKWQQGGPYLGDEEAYPLELPPLARPKVTVVDGEILIWTARI